MNATILAERMAKAVAAIEAETRRLGGELTLTPVRGDVAHQQLHALEIIAGALAGIDTPTATAEDDVAEEEASPDSAARSNPDNVEPVEAVITVVKEPTPPAKTASKGKGK